MLADRSTVPAKANRRHGQCLIAAIALSRALGRSGANIATLGTGNSLDFLRNLCVQRLSIHSRVSRARSCCG